MNELAKFPEGFPFNSPILTRKQFHKHNKVCMLIA